MVACVCPLDAWAQAPEVTALPSPPPLVPLSPPRLPIATSRAPAPAVPAAASPTPGPAAPPSRAARFAGTFIGAWTVTGASMAILTLRPAPCTSPGPCLRDVDALDYTVAMGWPVFSLFAGAGGAAIAGESFPAGAAFFGTLLGLGMTTPTWFAARELWVADPSTPMAPFIALAAPLVGVGTALAVDYRGEQLARGRWLGVDVAAPTSRVLLAGLASLGATALAAGGVGGLLGVVCPSNQSARLNCAVGLSIPALILPALAAWGAHRARGGRGTLLAAFLGVALAGFAVATTAFAANFSQGTPTGPSDFFWPGAGGLTLLLPAAFFGGPLALEASHADVLLDEREQALPAR